MDTTNEIFQIATRYVQQTNRHVFLTGKAGTGKTTFLHQIKKTTSKKLAVLAPTGVAAINAGGNTIHSFFQLPFGMYLPNHITEWGNDNKLVYNRQQLLSNLRLGSNKRELIKELELLIIDEVSMVRSDLLDAIDAVLQAIRRKEVIPFGGVQMLFIGDMYQLPPVLKDDQIWLHQKHYESPFFFDAKVMQQTRLRYIELNKIYRQEDKEFIDLLNNIRNNDCTYENLELLRSRYRPDFKPISDKYITLTSHNYKAQNINSLELQSLKGKVESFDAKISGNFPEHAYPTDFTVHLKLGAQVMFIKNDMGELKRYYNGKLAKVVSFDKEEETIGVLFEDSDKVFHIERAEWKNVQYNYSKENDRIEEDVQGIFMQFPLKLAWAVTIHKSQGLTFSRAIIDAGDSFAPGQVYVALSRLTGLDGLILKSTIDSNVIYTEPRIVAFSERIEQPQYLLEELEVAQQEYAVYILIQTFDLTKFQNMIAQNEQAYGSRSLPEMDYCLQWGIELHKTVIEMSKTSGQFRNQLNLLLTRQDIDYHYICERVTKASDWFISTLETKMLQSCKDHIVKMKVMKRTNKYVKEMTFIATEISRKINDMKSSVTLAKGLADSRPIQDLLEVISTKYEIVAASITNGATGTKPQKERSRENTREISLKMFKEGKSVDAIAAERGMVTSTIEGHLTDFIPTGEVNVYDFVTREQLENICKVINSAGENASLSEIKTTLGYDYSYGAIRAAKEWLKTQGEPGNQPG